jgi:hypothetical protein
VSVLAQLNEIATLAERGEEVMEMAIAAGQQAARDGDANRAAIGALAEVLCRRYSEGMLETFAKNIGVKARTVRSYRAVVRYYSLAHVCNLLEQGAAWSLLRETAQAYPDQPDAADSFLERALDAHMTIEEAERELALDTGHQPRPRVLLEMPVTVSRVDTERGVIVLSDLGDGVWELAGRMGATLMLRVTDMQTTIVAAAVRGASGAGSEAVSEAEAGS